jgi:hypothetical protein
MAGTRLRVCACCRLSQSCRVGASDGGRMARACRAVIGVEDVFAVPGATPEQPSGLPEHAVLVASSPRGGAELTPDPQGPPPAGRWTEFVRSGIPSQALAPQLAGLGQEPHTYRQAFC